MKHSITDMYVLLWSEGYGNFIDVFGLFEPLIYRGLTNTVYWI